MSVLHQISHVSFQRELYIKTSGMECCSITLFFQPLGDVLQNTIFFKTLIDFFLNEKQTLNDNWLSFRRSYGLGYQGISTTPTRTQGANYVQLLQYVQLLPFP